MPLILAILDVVIVVALPIAVYALARRGWPLWRSYATVITGYILYAAVIMWAVGYALTTYVFASTCLLVRKAIGKGLGACGSWELMVDGVLVLLLIPTAILWLATMLARKGSWNSPRS